MVILKYLEWHNEQNNNTNFNLPSSISHLHNHGNAMKTISELQAQKYKLLSIDPVSVKVIELTRGTFEHCNDYMVNHYEQNLIRNIEVKYTIQEIL